jgi:autotransporter-associated beta strand protein
MHRDTPQCRRFRGFEALESRLALSVVSWDGGGDGARWNDPLNWDSDGLPGASDDVIIDVAADPSIVLDGASASVQSAQIHERITFGNNTKLTIAAASDFYADVTMAPSSGLQGTGAATFHAALGVTSAVFYGPGPVTVASTGNLVTAGFITMLASLDIEGQTHWGALKLTLSSGRTITSRGDFIADSGSTMEVVSSGGQSSFVSEGTFTKLGAGAMVFTTGSNKVSFNSSGPVDVQAGTLTLDGPGTYSGPMTISAGAALRLLDQHQLSAGSSITGDGALAVGKVDLDVPVHVGRLEVVTGTAKVLTADFSVAGDVLIDGGFLQVDTDTTLQTLSLISSGLSGSGVLTIGQAMLWERGDMSGDGSTVLASGATLTIASTSDLLGLRRVLVNNGLIDWQDGHFGDGSTHQIENYGTVLARPTMSGDGPGIRNYAEFRKQGAGVARFEHPVENHGTFAVEEGALELAGGGGSTAPITVAGPASLLIDELLFTLPEGADITGAGALAFRGAAHQQVYAAIAVHDLLFSGFVECFGPVTTETGLFVQGGEAAFRAAASFGDNLPLHVTGGPVDLGDNTLRCSSGEIKGTIVTSGEIEITGEVTWHYLEISGGGLLRINEGAALSLPGDNRRTLGVDVENRGTISWSANHLVFVDAIIDNHGVFEIDNAIIVVTEGNGAVINRGVLRKLGPDGAGIGAGGDSVLFTNLGEVIVQGGTLHFQNATNFDEPAGVLTGGVWSVFGPGELGFHDAPIKTIAPGTAVSMSGPGATIVGMQGIEAIDGSLALLNDASVHASPASGVVTQSGLLELGISAELTVSGGFVQTPTAHLVVWFEHNHPVHGFGRLIADSVAVDGDFTAVALGGYLPPEGTMHEFVQAPSVTGTFDTATLPDAAPGDRWALRYDPDGITLLHTDFADQNLDGQVSTLDFLAYLNLWASGDSGADANGDGSVNVLDFLFWLNAFNDG